MIESVKYLTINTDASFNPKNGVCGYGFYIVCDKFRIMKGGAFRNKAESPMQAELWAMANALHTLVEMPNLPQVTNSIIINSDCLWAFYRIGRKSDNPAGRKVAKLLSKLREKTGVKVRPKFEFRHVKAHNGTPDARSWVNDWCDKEAKKWMRDASHKYEFRIKNQTNEKENVNTGTTGDNSSQRPETNQPGNTGGAVGPDRTEPAEV